MSISADIVKAFSVILTLILFGNYISATQVRFTSEFYTFELRFNCLVLGS